MKKLVAALMFLFATAVWAGDFEDGSAAYLKGDITTAASLFEKGAEQGDSAAQFNLAVIYNGVRGVSQDYAEAVRWYKLAAEQGNKSAQYNLEVMYYSSEEVLQDYLQAHMRINLIH